MGNIAFRMEIAAVLAVAAVMTACEKGGETVENGSPECEAFLAAATEYGLYSDGVPVRVFCRTEDQLVRDSEGTTLRIQNTEQSSVLACTFSSRPQSGVTIVARYEGTGFRSESRQCRIRGGEDGRHEGVAMVRGAGTGHRS